MKPQTFRAPSTQLALEQVQQEFGPEALILSVRQVPVGPAWQVWKHPEVEVMALPAPDSNTRMESAPTPASRPNTLPPRSTKTAPTQARANGDTPDISILLSMLAERIEKTPKPPAAAAVEKALEPALPSQPAAAPAARPAAAPKPVSPNRITWTKEMAQAYPALAAARAKLLTQGIAEELVDKLIAACSASLNPASLEDSTRIRTHLQRQLEACLHDSLNSPLPSSSTRRVIFLVGASGAGKTSACARLAASALQTPGKKVTWICADTIRTGAIAIARAYTETLGAALYLAYSPEELAGAVAAEPDSDLVLVDTPACNPRNQEEVIALGAYLTALRQREVFLVASATSKDTDHTQSLAAFSPFRLDGLVVTKLDETDTFGAVVNMAWRSQLPLRYFTDGPQIGDIQSGQATRLVKLLFGDKGYSK